MQWPNVAGSSTMRKQPRNPATASASAMSSRTAVPRARPFAIPPATTRTRVTVARRASILAWVGSASVEAR